jgi:hypothetical protein
LLEKVLKSTPVIIYMSLKTDFDESFFEDLLKLLLALQRHRGGVGGGGGGVFKALLDCNMIGGH